MYLCSEDNPSLKFPYHLQYYLSTLQALQNYRFKLSHYQQTKRAQGGAIK